MRITDGTCTHEIFVEDKDGIDITHSLYDKEGFWYDPEQFAFVVDDAEAIVEDVIDFIDGEGRHFHRADDRAKEAGYASYDELAEHEPDSLPFAEIDGKTYRYGERIVTRSLGE